MTFLRLIATSTDRTAVSWHNLLHTIDGLVAVGTLSLAAVTAVLVMATFWMARRTATLARATNEEVTAVAEQIDLDRQSVEALRDQVAVARLSAQSAVRPVLVDVHRPLVPEAIRGALETPEHEIGWEAAQETRRVAAPDSIVWGNERAIYISVPLRNVGPGTAFIRGIGIQWLRGLPGEGVATLAVVPPQEGTRIQFTVQREHHEDLPTVDEFSNYGTFTLDVAYTDVSGEQWTKTSAHVHRDPGGRWLTRQVFLYHMRGGQEGSYRLGRASSSLRSGVGCLIT
jgi:hypothetical protein